MYDAPKAVMRTAGAWLAKRDRGFTPEEQAQFDHWRRSAPSHAAAVRQLERTMTTFDRLGELASDYGGLPDPDAFAPKAEVRRKRSLRWWVPAISVAAAAAFALLLYRPAARTATALQHFATVSGGYQHLTLADGSVVDLNGDTILDVAFAPGERRVRLSRGEAHFQVAKNPARPFIVSAGSVSFRAVGTAFNIRLGTADVELLVTEGKVQVSPPPTETPIIDSVTRPDRIPLVEAGYRVLIPLAPAPPPRIAAVTPADIEQRLAWQPRLLELRKTPLSQIVAELNQHAPAGSPRIVIADDQLADFRIGGNFRADQADAFVRLLETSFDVSVERSSDTITLRRAR
jgi:transmembrane sensor